MNVFSVTVCRFYYFCAVNEYVLNYCLLFIFHFFILLTNMIYINVTCNQREMMVLVSLFQDS